MNTPMTRNSPMLGAPRRIVLALVIGFCATCTTLLHAAAGPDPVTWIPTATTETVGALTVRIQNATLHARDVQRLFVTAVAGSDLRVLAANSDGGADYFDQRMDNGLYAIFGSVKPGTLTLTVQTAPTGTSTWTTAGTLTRAVGPKRVLAHDIDVDIATWYICPPAYNAGTITSAAFTALLDNHFSDMQARGFTKASMNWRPTPHPTVLFAKAAQYNLKIQPLMWRTNDWIEGSAGKSLTVNQHHNVPLLSLETNLKNDGILSNVGGGVLMKDHPNLDSYYITDEPLPASSRAVQLGAMLVKSIDPLHTAAAVIAQDTNAVANMAARATFLDTQMIDPYPLGNTNPLNVAGSNPSAAGDFGRHYPFSTIKQPMSWPDYVEWAQALRPDVPQEVLIQAFGSPPSTIYWRVPSTKEISAQVFMALSRGARTVNYFLYCSQTGGETMTGLRDVNDNPTANLVEAGIINAKVAGWIPIYGDLVKDDNGTHIPYATLPASSTVIYSNGFETGANAFTSGGSQAVVATNTFSPAHTGTMTGLAGTGGGNGFTRSHYLGFNLCSYPRYSGATWETWVHSNGNTKLQTRMGAVFKTNTGGTPSTINGYSTVGAGWAQKTRDLSSFVADPKNTSIDLLWFGAMTPVAADYTAHYLDDLKFTLTKPAYRPNYQYQGGVVGNFTHCVTNDQYIIVVNTDTVNARDVTVNVVKNDGGVPVNAQDVDTGAIYPITNSGTHGSLTVNIPAGDGVLLAIDSAVFADNPFVLPLANGTTLNGKAVASYGFTGNYTTVITGHTGSSGTATYTTTGLTFGPNFRPVSGGAAVVSAIAGPTNGTSHDTRLRANIAGTATGTVYSAYLLRFTGSTWRTDNSGSTNVSLAAGGLRSAINQASSFKNVVGVGMGSSTPGPILNPALNTTYLVVAKHTRVGLPLSSAEPGVCNLWVLTQSGFDNWVAAGSGESALVNHAVATANASVTSGTFNLDGLMDLRIYSGNFANNNITATFDEFRAASTLSLALTD